MTSIRTTLMVRLLAALSLLLALVFVALYFSVRQQLFASFDQSLLAKAEAIGGMAHQEPDGRINLEIASDTFLDFSRKERPEYFELRRADGAIIERSRSLIGTGLPTLNRRPTVDEFYQITLPDGRTGRAVLSPTTAEQETRAVEEVGQRPAVPIVVAVATDIQEITVHLRRLLTALVVCTIALVVGGAVLVTTIVRRGMKPLDQIASHAAALEPHRLTEPYPTTNLPRELMPIAAGVHGLMQRVAAVLERESRFTAHAAHELRTPLASVRANCEVALRWPEPADSQQTLSSILNTTVHMQSLASKLLQMAHARAGQVRAEPEPADISRLVKSTCEALEASSRSRSIKIDFDTPAPTVAWVDPTLAMAVIENLVSNAIAHAPAGSTVKLHCATEGIHVIFRCDNEAPALSQEDLEKVTEPFWTKSSSRSHGHRGLGMAIASEYCDLLGAGLSLKLPSPGNFRAQVNFPTQPDAIDLNLA